MSSDTLAAALGVDSGAEAEAMATAAIADQAPHLLIGLDFDSYDTVFCAYADNGSVAVALVALLRELPPR